MPRGGWVFAPDSGGVKIPEAVRRQTEQRIRKYAEEHFAGKYTRLEVRFRGVFCYFDAYTEPDLPPDWTPLERRDPDGSPVTVPPDDNCLQVCQPLQG